MKKVYISVIAVLLLVCGCTGSGSGQQAKAGDSVLVHYTGKLSDGTVFDSSVGKEPLEVLLGSGLVIRGFDQAVTGMKVGEKKTVTIPAADAYGAYNPNLIMDISRSQISSNVTLDIGRMLQFKNASGDTRYFTIKKVSDTTVTVDGNHALAGKDLTFEIEVVKIL